MSDTQRTKAQLAALFADNTSGAITPQMLRDFLESCSPSMGGCHFVDPGTPTAIATPATFVKAANVSTSLGLSRFSMPANNRLRYDGLVAVRVRVIATLSFTCASNNQVLAFAIAINGVVDITSKIRTKISAGVDIQAVTIMVHATMNPGDYAEVWIANDTSTGAITIEHGHVHCLGFLS